MSLNNLHKNYAKKTRTLLAASVEANELSKDTAYALINIPKGSVVKEIYVQQNVERNGGTISLHSYNEVNELDNKLALTSNKVAAGIHVLYEGAKHFALNASLVVSIEEEMTRGEFTVCVILDEPRLFNTTYTHEQFKNAKPKPSASIAPNPVPVITLIGADPITLTELTAYNEQGATAIDYLGATVPVTIGGDFVNVSIPGTYTVTYNATDSYGGVAQQKTRVVNIIANNAPVITLNGNNPDNVPVRTVLSGIPTLIQDVSKTTAVWDASTNTINWKVVNSDSSNYTAKAVWPINQTLLPDNVGYTISIEVDFTNSQAYNTGHHAFVGFSLVDPVLSSTENWHNGRLVDGISMGFYGDVPGYILKLGYGVGYASTQTVVVPILAPNDLNTGTYKAELIVTSSTDYTIKVYRDGTLYGHIDYVITEPNIDLLTTHKVKSVMTASNTNYQNGGKSSSTKVLSIAIERSYTDPGATAVDAEDGPLVVTTIGNVDVTVAGTYTLTYLATDSGGKSTSITRTVNVVAPANTAPVITLNGNNPDNIAMSDPSTKRLWGFEGNVAGVFPSSGITKVNTLELLDSDNNVIPLEGGWGYQDSNGTGALAFDGDDTTVSSTPSVSNFARVGWYAVQKGNEVVSKIRIVTSTDAPLIRNGHPVGIQLSYEDFDSNIVIDQAFINTLLGNGGASQTAHYVQNVDTHGEGFEIIETVTNAPIPLVISQYADPGATAVDTEDGPLAVTTTGSVDITVAGTYTLTYSATDSQGLTDTKIRTVNVVAANTAPVITLNGNNPDNINKVNGTLLKLKPQLQSDTAYHRLTLYNANLNIISANYSSPVKVSNDQIDLNIPTGTTNPEIIILLDKVQSTLLTGINISSESSNSFNIIGLTVEVSSDGGTTWVQNTENLNYSIPTGFGSVTTTLDTAIDPTSSQYNDPGAAATDAEDGALPVTVSGNVDTITVGTYTLTYSATDSNGLTTTETRTINVT